LVQNSPQQQNHPDQNDLAEPFSQIFVDRTEADWAFDLLRQTTDRLRVTGPYDPRVAVTLSHRSGRVFLRLNFGGWLVVGFRGPGQTAGRVDMALLADLVSWDERLAAVSFERKEGQPEVRSYELPVALVRPMTSDLQQAYEATLDFIANKFASWKKASHWKQHNPEIIEALYDRQQRAQLFAGALAEMELKYERHLTAFHYELAEEEGLYGDEKMGRWGDGEMGTTAEISLRGERVMGQENNQLEEALKNAFSRFKRNLQDCLVVKIRRKQIKKLVDILSDPLKIDLETFNREVWILKSGAYLRGVNIDTPVESFDEEFTNEQIAEIEQALDSGELEFHGNSIWGSGARIYAPRLKDDEQKLENIRQAIEILHSSKLSPMQKAEKITEIYGFGNNVATGLVMVFHPDKFGLYNEKGKQILKGLGYEEYNTLAEYETTLQYLKEILGAEDFVELDWFLYLVNQGKYDISSYPEADNLQPPNLQSPISQSPPIPLTQLAEETGLDEPTLSRWVRAIERKKQAILYGPPGTGKTYMAEWLARHLTGGGDGFWELVQFHPAYAYEDFMQGIRPQSEGGRLNYHMVPGRFLEFCRQAAERDGHCVLIIDEINRANLSRVFGELMYLLEYRNREIPLSGGGRFQIPANIRLIGTMNTADRSIALVDHALRRRFAFIALRPNFDVLRHYHQKHQTGFDPEGLVNVLTRLNRQIGDAHYAVGITFFLHDNLANQLADIWRMEIEPYLEEYFFDQPDPVDTFRWESVKQEILSP